MVVVVVVVTITTTMMVCIKFITFKMMTYKKNSQTSPAVEQHRRGWRRSHFAPFSGVGGVGTNHCVAENAAHKT